MLSVGSILRLKGLVMGELIATGALKGGLCSLWSAITGVVPANLRCLSYAGSSLRQKGLVMGALIATGVVSYTFAGVSLENLLNAGIAAVSPLHPSPPIFHPL